MERRMKHAIRTAVSALMILCLTAGPAMGAGTGEGMTEEAETGVMTGNTRAAGSGGCEWVEGFREAGSDSFAAEFSIAKEGLYDIAVIQASQGGHKENIGELFRQALPHDLIKFGMIPEFVGRVPVMVALDMLDEDALVRILTEPKNAITRQYAEMVRMDNVELEFEDEAIRTIARRSNERKTGARGLRAIMESIMLDPMYEIPSEDNVVRCIITKEAAEGLEKPVLIRVESENGKKKKNETA